MSTFLIALFLMAQNPDGVSDPSEGSPDPASTGGEQNFNDPFANEPNGETPPSDAPAIPTPAPETSPSPEGQTPSNVIEPGEPQYEPPPPPPPVQEAPAPETRKEFNFPEVEGAEGPISEDVRRTEESSSTTSIGTWSLRFAPGAGINLNRRHQQVHLELAGAYRAWNNQEIGLLTYGRFVRDRIAGFLATYEYYIRLNDPPEMRMELGLLGGMGYALYGRNTFSQGRLVGRVSADLLMYASPDFILVPTLGMDSFFWSWDSNGKSKSLMGGGPPTQIVVGMGIRFEF